MSLAPFFERSAVAASQVLRGYSETTFRTRLEGSAIGISLGEDACTGEGRHAADLTVRLLSRLYPTIVFHVDSRARADAQRLSELARRINPNIEVRDSLESTCAIILGVDGPLPSSARNSIYIGSDGWDAHTSLSERRTFGTSNNPFGAGAAAALASAHIFATVFDQASPCALPITFSTFDGTVRATENAVDLGTIEPLESCALIGLGAIGNAAIWALDCAGVVGNIALVDHEAVDLSNLQRYVLAEITDAGRPKAEHITSLLRGSLRGAPHSIDFETFVSRHGYVWDQFIVAVDSAKVRRKTQAALPRRLVNAWTQVEDLGISEHGLFGSDAACLECLYIQSASSKNFDEIVASSLQIPEHVLEVRALLYSGETVPHTLIDLLIERFGAPPEVRAELEGLAMQRLYAHALCGSALLRFDDSHLRPRDLHVPAAHQSALAGVLLAARALRQRVRPTLPQTQVTRIDLRSPLPETLTIAENAMPDGPCICRDDDFVASYQRKYRTVDA